MLVFSATVDMIPAVLTDVVRLLKHDRELVRKKAVMVLHRMNQLDPDVSRMGERWACRGGTAERKGRGGRAMVGTVEEREGLLA